MMAIRHHMFWTEAFRRDLEWAAQLNAVEQSLPFEACEAWIGPCGQQGLCVLRRLGTGPLQPTLVMARGCHAAELASYEAAVVVDESSTLCAARLSFKGNLPVVHTWNHEAWAASFSCKFIRYWKWGHMRPVRPCQKISASGCHRLAHQHSSFAVMLRELLFFLRENSAKLYCLGS